MNNFRFKVNVSIEAYRSKTDASACLSRRGAKAIGKEKMAFREVDVTVDEFLQYALGGHAFCGLFDYDPSQQYWLETSAGKRYQTYPEYKTGPNKGGMKTSFKSDRFFRGAQVVFVDIDYTRFESVPDYLNCLTLPPTCVYMSFSDKQEKHGVVSRRFRLVYVFHTLLDREELNIVSASINAAIERDTGEPIEDLCGTKVSQYMNGVYGNDEHYASYRIYWRSEFPDTLPQPQPIPIQQSVQATQSSAIIFDEHLLNDMAIMDYKRFMHFYSVRYRYFYRTERPGWINNTYQLTDDNYLQLWWPAQKITDGNNRRRKLYKRACMRRLICLDVDQDTLLFNMYVDFNRFIDNSDGVITLDTLKRRTQRAMLAKADELLQYCSYEIEYWRNNRPEFILHPSIKPTQELINSISKTIHFNQIGELYDRSLPVKENCEVLDESLSTLYRFCNEAGIATNPNKVMTKSQTRLMKKEEKRDKKMRFMMLYNPNISEQRNKEFMEKSGLRLSIGTVHNWSKEYVVPQGDANDINGINSTTGGTEIQYTNDSFLLSLYPEKYRKWG